MSIKNCTVVFKLKRSSCREGKAKDNGVADYMEHVNISIIYTGRIVY